MSRREQLLWAVPAALLCAMMVFGAVIGQAKGRIDAAVGSPVTVELTATVPTFPVPVGARFTSEIVADGAVGLGGFSVDLRYPPDRVRVDAVDVHPVLRGSGRGTLELDPAVDPSRGTVRLAAVSCPADPCGGELPALPALGPGGRLTLATVYFTAVDAGEVSLSVERASLGDTGRRQQGSTTSPLALTVLPAGYALTWYDSVPGSGTDWLLAQSLDPAPNPISLRVGNRAFLDAVMDPGNIFTLFFRTVRDGPITLTTRRPEPLRVARRSYPDGAPPFEVPARPFGDLSDHWILPPFDPAGYQLEVVVANLNGLDVDAVVSVGGAEVARGRVAAQSTLAIPLPDVSPPVEVRTTLPHDGGRVPTLVTARVRARPEAGGATVVEVPAFAPRDLGGRWVAPGPSEKASGETDAVLVAYLATEPALVILSVEGREADRATIAANGFHSFDLSAAPASGAVTVRAMAASDLERAVPVAVARVQGRGRTLERITPAQRLDRLTPEVDFPWQHLGEGPAEERLVVTNPSARPLAFRVFGADGALGDGAVAANGVATFRLPAGLKSAVWVLGFDPSPPFAPQPVASHREVRWRDRVGVLPGVPTTP